MTRINKNIRNAVKRGTQYPAVVIDVHGSRASARLSTSGAIVHNLAVIGGPVAVGELVSVDYTTQEPTIVAIAREWLTESDLNAALKKLGNDSFLNRFSWKILNFAQGELINVYDPSDDGFDEAIAGTPSGGHVLLPSIELEDDHSVSGGVRIVGMSRSATIINGQLSLGGDGGVENLKIYNAASSSSPLFGIKGAGLGTAIIQNCDISAINSGSGSAYALNDNGVTMYVYNSKIYGSASSGSGYAAFSSGGNIYLYGGSAYGSDDLFLVT